ncbi:MAG: exopolyphosphatase [Bacteroidetes bacterium]|nr:exopolyphosphatase [Bacteroidota bacterium]
MKHAILDLGTNTFHLLIVEANSDYTYTVLHESKSVVKLGEGAIERNFIEKVPFQRGVKAVVNFARQIRNFSVNHIHAFATSAVRGASNGSEFVEEVFAKTGIKISVIKGEQEAELIYFGIRQCVELSPHPVLMMDIGGGSVEFIIGSNEKIFWKGSYNIGVARLLEHFSPSDPISNSQISEIEKFLEFQLQSLSKAIQDFPVQCIIGSSGSFESYAEMIAPSRDSRPDKHKSCTYEFQLNDYFNLHESLIRSTRKERKLMKGLLKMRVDMIVLASIITNLVLQKYSITQMKLSEYSLKEGALWKCLRQEGILA